MTRHHFYTAGLVILVNLHEAPRELVEGLTLWGFGLLVGRWHLRRRVIQPAERRHQEQMAAHRAVHRHLGIGGDT